MINQIHSLFEFIQTNGSIKEFAERTEPRNKSDLSERGIHKRKQNDRVHLLENSASSDGIHIELPEKFSKAIQSKQQSKMDRVNGIDMNFIHKKRGHSRETHRLWIERKQILKREKKPDSRKRQGQRATTRVSSITTKQKENRGIEHADLQ